MAKIEVKLVYWPISPTSHAWIHRKLGEKVDVEEEDLAEIAKKHKTVTIVAEKASKRHLKYETGVPPLPPYPGPLPRTQKIPKTIIRVTGDTEYSVKNCVKDLLKLYGIPDETPGGFLRGKKGKRIVESALRELGF